MPQPQPNAKLTRLETASLMRKRALKWDLVEAATGINQQEYHRLCRLWNIAPCDVEPMRAPHSKR